MGLLDARPQTKPPLVPGRPAPVARFGGAAHGGNGLHVPHLRYFIPMQFVSLGLPFVRTLSTKNLNQEPFKGKEIKVSVTEDGFRWNGENFKSLTALARAVTKYPSISGPAFFAKRD